MDLQKTYILTGEEVEEFQQNIIKKANVVAQIKILDKEFDERNYEEIIERLEEVEMFKLSWWDNLFKKYRIEKIPGCNYRFDPDKKEIHFVFEER